MCKRNIIENEGRNSERRENEDRWSFLPGLPFFSAFQIGKKRRKKITLFFFESLLKYICTLKK